MRGIAKGTLCAWLVLLQPALANQPPAAKQPAAKEAPAQAGAHHEAAPAFDPKEEIEGLKAGNQRFVDGKMTLTHEDPQTRTQLVSGQSPRTIVLGCADSRVPPEVVFDQGLGDLFVVRVAGNIINSDNLASIEYAVEHLGSRLLLVLGHESCGAVKASINTPKGKSAGSPNLDKLVGAIQKNIGKKNLKADPADTLLHAQVQANLQSVLKDLPRKSKILKKRIDGKELLAVGAIYSLASGKVEWLE